MTDRPILFSAPMIRALLDGRKTQTRRVVKPQPGDMDRPFRMEDGTWHVTDSRGGHMSALGSKHGLCPYGVPGDDRLWVKETTIRTPAGVAYAADGGDHFGAGGRLRKTPAIHCRRVDSRITLEVSDVRVERLQDISEADALAEGFPETCVNRPRIWYANLWDDINGPESWDANPWCWAVSFKRVTA